MLYHLYNADQPVASFGFEKGVITHFVVENEHLVPKQLCHASADRFTHWLRNRAINLSSSLHRQLAYELFGYRDQTAIVIKSHMFSMSDTFTCFADDELIPHRELCNPKAHEAVSSFMLNRGKTKLSKGKIITPNSSTDGSFPKTWKYANSEWWLYKLQSADASRCEREISQLLMACGWSAAEYQYPGSYRTQIKSRCFVSDYEFFEPYDSLRFMFEDKSDDAFVICENIASLGAEFERDYRRLLLADALFMNIDRHLRNYGVIRSSVTGEIVRMAPNFDNNQAYCANPGGHYSDAMLRDLVNVFGFRETDIQDLRMLLVECAKRPFMKDAYKVGSTFLLSVE